MFDREDEERLLSILEYICNSSSIRTNRDEDLFAAKMLDSLGAIELLVAIEDEFGVSIAPTEVERSNMNTVNLIIARVAERYKK